MYEGEINMVVHADGGTADVMVEKDKVTIILEDRGPGISDMELAMQEGYSTASQDVRELGFGAGMGLPNMKKYSDSLEINSEVGKGTKVTMVIHIPG
jgi:anti-sigma regulatory factor (Ser/Thr protein kinase)